VKKTAALLLAWLVTAHGAYAQEKSPAAPAPPGTSSAKIDTRKLKAGDDYITLNFTNIDLTALVKVMSELMRRNFVLDERVTGKVTLLTPTKISPDEAYRVFLSALEMKGFTAVDDGPITRIIPAATARQSGLDVMMDGDYEGRGFVTKLIRLTYVNPNELVRTLTPLVSRDGSLIAYPATNSLIITDAVPNVKKIESLIQSLDVTTSEGKGKINVYYLKHANSEDFAKVMAALVARLPVPHPGAAAQPAGPATILEGQVTITSDKATNSVIIVASPGDYETIRDVIQKLDIRRRQVYVEAAIIEMSLTKQRELGFEFQATNYDLDNNKISGIGGTNFGNIGNAIAGGPAALAGMNGLAIGAVKGTFTFKGVEYLNVGALLRALQTDGDVNVLSTPNILTTDNQKAEIMVGENVPFVGSQTQSATTGGIPTYNIDRKDVGITLKLTPQITSDDNVRLDIYQEISDIVQTAGINPNLLGPSTSKRSASTTVVIKDRETMVIGGLIRDNVTSSTSKVPLLGDIPILGWLFKFKNTRVEKTNLMIFITPYIIKNETEAGEVTRRKSEGLEEFRKEYRIERKSDQPTMLTTPPHKTAPETNQQKENDTALQSEPSGTTGIQSIPTGTIPAAPANGGPAEPAPADTGRAAPADEGASLQTTPSGTAPAGLGEDSR
jgi:general secretion pathway protein D